MYGLVNGERKGRAMEALSWRSQQSGVQLYGLCPRKERPSAGFQKVHQLTDESKSVTDSEAASTRVQ